MILVASIAIILAFAIYTKVWFSLLPAVIMAIEPVGSLFIPESINRDPTAIAITIIIFVIITIGLFVYLFRKGKKA